MIRERTDTVAIEEARLVLVCMAEGFFKEINSNLEVGKSLALAIY